jgi:hypothetical protein
VDRPNKFVEGFVCYLPVHLTFTNELPASTLFPANMAAGADQLYAMKFPFKDPKFIFFTDFDGTITLKDSNDYMVGVLCSLCREQ